MTSNIAFWDKIAPKYANQPVANPAAYEKKLNIIRRYLTPASSVVELGCGTGSTALALADKAADIKAMDVSPAMIEIAQQKAADQGARNVCFQCANAEDGKPPHPVDMVMAHNLLHLVSSHRDLISQIYLWLKPGGIFVTNTPCLSDNYGFLRWLGPIGSALGVMPKVKVFSKAEHIQSLKAVGFEVVERWDPQDGRTLFAILRKP